MILTEPLKNNQTLYCKQNFFSLVLFVLAMQLFSAQVVPTIQRLAHQFLIQLTERGPGFSPSWSWKKKDRSN